MHWKPCLIALPVTLNAGYMVFDGVHAFATGDYMTPKTGTRTGQLGPWSTVVRAVGLNPRSSFVKGFLVMQGMATLALLGCYFLRWSWAAAALKGAAIAGLWYLPIGTILNTITLILLFIA